MTLQQIIQKISNNKLLAKLIQSILCRLKKLETNSGGDFIPLTGTEQGKPVTGNVQFGDGIDSEMLLLNNKGVIFLGPVEVEGQNKFCGFKLANNSLLIQGQFFQPDETDLFAGLVGNRDFSEMFFDNSLIYAQRSYVNKANSYSTDEIRTGGTWINGKPIYRKVIESTTIDGIEYINIESLNIEKLVEPIRGVVEFTSNNPAAIHTIGIPFSQTGDSTGTGTQTINFTIRKYRRDIRVEYFKIKNTETGTKSYMIDNNYHLILEYTKTTD